MEKVSEEHFKRHYKFYKHYYDTYMFGNMAYSYYEYCRIKECAYGEMLSLIQFSSLVEAITEPDTFLLPFIPETGESNKEDFDQSESYLQHQARLIYYSEYKKWCGLNNVDLKKVQSYLQYLECNGYDFL